MPGSREFSCKPTVHIWFELKRGTNVPKGSDEFGCSNVHVSLHCFDYDEVASFASARLLIIASICSKTDLALVAANAFELNIHS